METPWIKLYLVMTSNDIVVMMTSYILVIDMTSRIWARVETGVQLAEDECEKQVNYIWKIRLDPPLKSRVIIMNNNITLLLKVKK